MTDTPNSPNEALGVAARAMCGLPPDAEWSLDVTIALAAVRDALEALDAAGWVLFPKEPTQAINEAMDAVPERPIAGYWNKVHDAAVAAAPKLSSSS